MDNTQGTHTVIYRGAQRSCTPENYDEVCEELFEQFGAPDKENFPRFREKRNGETAGEYGTRVHDEFAKSVQAIETTGEPAKTPAGQVDTAGRLRTQADEHAALEGGFAPKPPVYAAGTRVLQAGVDNARRDQLEHDAKPSAREVAAQLVSQVEAEQRRDLPPISTGKLRMDKTGRVVVSEPTETRYPLTTRAFDSIFGRFPCASGTAYLKSCPTVLRARNFNHWAVEVERREIEQGDRGRTNQTVLRLRDGGAGPEIFASVSPSYTAFDADKIGRALQQAFPEDAKGSLDYNGERFRIEGLWRTDVAPEEFVAGEFFKAGVIIRSDDTGGGSLRLQSVLWRNLCLNLIILDKAIGVDIRIKHQGSEQKLARKFREAFSKALRSVEPFRRAWGYAIAERDERLVERVQGTTSEDLSKLPASAVLPGLFNGVLDRELVPIKGRRKDVVPKLLEMHAQDEAREAYGVSRASVVNAFTRYAHQIEEDPFAADEIRAGAGKLLSSKAGRQPAPLPYAPIQV